MKKVLLSLGLLFSCCLFTYGQLSFIVNTPADIEGGYSFNYVDTASWILSPDMNIPANSITNDLLLVDDGTEADSLGCGDNYNDLTGKIALIHRGVCEFGDKALRAEQAGALAVVIINREPGSPVAMGAGTFGAQVSIPVVMISLETGMLIREKIDAGETVNVFLGNKFGLFENDLGFDRTTVFGPRMGAVPGILAQNSAEYTGSIGLFAFNFGSLNQSSLTATATIELNGALIYDETSASVSLNSGDTVFIGFPDFAQDSYEVGIYKLTYKLNLPSEEFPLDNEYTLRFSITENTIGLVQLDASEIPIFSSGIRPGGDPAPQNFQVCIVYQNENADRVKAKGMRFTASTATDQVLTNRNVSIDVFEWNDEFTPEEGPTFTEISPRLNEETIYDFFDNSLQNVSVYKDFDGDAVPLENNIRYLFCATPSDDKIFIGHDDVINYDRVIQEFGQFVMVNRSGSTFFTGWSDPTYPAITLVTEPSIIGLAEAEKLKLNAFPNPANDFITIPVTGYAGNGVLTVIDIAGKVIINEKINIDSSAKLKVNISAISSGLYNFNVVLENGKKGSIKVLVNK